MKKVYGILLLVLMYLTACDSRTNIVNTTIQLSDNTLELSVGDMATVSAVVTPSGTVSWTSSNEKVVQVYAGVVEAIGIGHAQVIARTADGASATCLVYVMGEKGESLSLSPNYMQVKKGDTYQYTFTSTYDLPLTWKSSDENVATVDDTGLVTAHNSGHTTISLSTELETVSVIFAVEHTWGAYQLVWEEEFEGNTLDLSVWNIEVNGSGGGNQELQYYTDRPQNLRVQNGKLEIQALKESYSNPDGKNQKNYTSARINTYDKKYFKYGKIEARISFPAGKGTWPAFWMLGNDYRQNIWPKCGEIDIIEHVGSNPRMLSFAVHTPAKNTSHNWYAQKYVDNVENNYHVYGIEWQEEESYGCDKILFTYDGEVCATIMEDVDHLDENFYWPFNKEHFIILNLAIGGKMGGEVDDSIFNQDVIMYVDWVRVYQRAEINE